MSSSARRPAASQYDLDKAGVTPAELQVSWHRFGMSVRMRHSGPHP